MSKIPQGVHPYNCQCDFCIEFELSQPVVSDPNRYADDNGDTWFWDEKVKMWMPEVKDPND